MAALLSRIFRRKKQPPLVCAISLDSHGEPLGNDPSHVHTSACFIDIEPLALIELFQSQGCVSCPPAVPGIQAAATNSPNRLLLTYNVTIFDHLGWKDTFARPSWDQRQRAYLTRWQRNSLYTPQVVINGVVDSSGAHGASDIDDAVQRGRSAIQQNMAYHMLLDANDTEVRIDSDAPAPTAAAPPYPAHSHMGMEGADAATLMDMPPAPAAAPAPAMPTIPTYDILLAVYRAGDETIKIGKGPNKGKKLVHRNIVDNIVKLGEWNGGNVTVPLPSSRSSMKKGVEAVAFVQLPSGGPIVAATKI